MATPILDVVKVFGWNKNRQIFARLRVQLQTFVADMASPYTATITRPKVEWALTIFDGSSEGASSPFYVKCAARTPAYSRSARNPIGASLQEVTEHIILLHRLLERPDHSRNGE